MDQKPAGNRRRSLRGNMRIQVHKEPVLGINKNPEIQY